MFPTRKSVEKLDFSEIPHITTFWVIFYFIIIEIHGSFDGRYWLWIWRLLLFQLWHKYVFFIWADTLFKSIVLLPLMVFCAYSVAMNCIISSVNIIISRAASRRAPLASSSSSSTSLSPTGSSSSSGALPLISWLRFLFRRLLNNLQKMVNQRAHWCMLTKNQIFTHHLKLEQSESLHLMISLLTRVVRHPSLVRYVVFGVHLYRHLKLL